MGTAFSSSLLGLSGSLILGFLDLQAGRAQNRFYTQLENWLSSVTDTSVEGPREFSAAEPGAVVSTERSLAAMTSLAEGIQGLVKNMRSEQQMLRDWIEAQQEESKSLRRTLDRLSARIDGDAKSPGRTRHDNGSE
jgi:predicted RNase H-like nuclease (RuvC/YqgF family)